ncbi:hypothetical protein RRG08_027596 [Elysia crispata]|uniref:Uncharacterized protein n=1 Tax=Elysia crispata TaxID=231223 RepID=A0AAE1AF27_9GAST|nr:hypothetical protein RRG08_027596 [Elysia crispata]
MMMSTANDGSLVSKSLRNHMPDRKVPITELGSGSYGANVEAWAGMVRVRHSALMSGDHAVQPECLCHPNLYLPHVNHQRET